MFYVNNTRNGNLRQTFALNQLIWSDLKWGCPINDDRCEKISRRRKVIKKEKRREWKRKFEIL